MINIIPAGTCDYVQVELLLSEYAASLENGSSSQNLGLEPAAEYAPPSGCVLVAKEELDVVGCVALRHISDDACEMMRLYVRPSFRERGIGRTLSESLIGEARARGYRVMRLGVLYSMREALRLYESLGFRKIAPYRLNAGKGTLFMQLDITTSFFP